mmetsp:Transcript_5936/g.14204  ORF Transcript_5936/g.14204 Transcript_5936/m.14204 type:complete len:104 (-) Transcript_5936:142-453(-)
MVYFDNFDKFQTAAQSLFIKAPLRTRYLAKYRNCDQDMVLKVTDDRVCLKFRTSNSADIKKIEQFTQSFARWATTEKIEDIAENPVDLEEALEAGKAKKRRKK